MKSLLQKIRKNYKYIIFFFAFFIINLFFFKNMYNDLGHRKTYLFISIGAIILEIVGVLLLNKLTAKKIKIENIFLIYGIAFGLLYLIILPIGTVPDEAAHFRRAYEISEGHLISDKNKDGVGGRKLPTSISTTFSLDVHKSTYKQVINLIAKTKDYKEKSFQTFGNTSLYAAVCYIPQAAGILIGRILHLPMVLVAYLARLFNLACFLAIIYFSIKYIPINKKIIILTVFLPISMQAASSIQPDALTNAISFALLSFVLYKIDNKKRLTKKEKILMCSLAIIMSLCKIVYIPICLLLYLLPESCFSNKRDKYRKITLLGLLVVILNLVWLLISSSYLVEFQEGVNSGLQVKWILTNPIKYMTVLFNTINQKGMYYFFTSLGSYLGYFDMLLSEVYLAIYFLFAIYVLSTENNKISKSILKGLNKFLVVFIILVCVALIFTSLYVQWTAHKAEIISGVQGRYFIPLFLMISLIFMNPKLKIDTKDNTKYVFTISCMLSVYSLMTIIFYHI